MHDSIWREHMLRTILGRSLNLSLEVNWTHVGLTSSQAMLHNYDGCVWANLRLIWRGKVEAAVFSV